jgi:hypothetical protein
MRYRKGKSEGGSGSGSVCYHPDSLNSQHNLNSTDVSKVEPITCGKKIDGDMRG